jgi:hypothetical protein
MFDNLRQQLAEGSQEPDNDVPKPTSIRSGEPGFRLRRSGARGRAGFLGLTPAQLFIVSLMLFLNVSVLGCFALVVFNKVVLF